VSFLRMARPQLESSAARSLGIMLVLIALAGKLAFFQLRASSNAGASTMLLEQNGGQLSATLQAIQQVAHGDKLNAKMESLKQERAELTAQLAKVAAEQQHENQLKKEKAAKKVEDAKVEHAIVVAHKKEVHALKSTLQAEEQQKHQLLKQVSDMRGVGTHTDEAMVKLVMSQAQQERKEHELSARLVEADRAKAAAAQERRAEAAVSAHEDLLKKGLVKASTGPMAKSEKAMVKVQSQQQQLQDAEWKQEQAQNSKLVSANAKLEHEIAVMKAKEAQREAKEREEMRVVRGKSDTGLGKRLSKAGVVVDSWGPVTSTAGTRPDPRDTFAKLPRSMILPAKIKQPKPAPAHAKTIGELEKDLGFKASILYSKTFDKEW